MLVEEKLLTLHWGLSCVLTVVLILLDPSHPVRNKTLLVSHQILT